MSAVDSQTFFDEITSEIDENGATGAVQLCKETEGPVSAIFHAGLSRMHRGLGDVEKAIQNAGSIEMAFLEKKYDLAECCDHPCTHAWIYRNGCGND